MLATLANPILPIFAILALGYGLQRAGIFDEAIAKAINRFVFYVATPALIFSIVSTSPIDQFDFRALGLYFAAQVLVYVGTALCMHLVLGRDKGEALLLGMTATFVNHVFFVLPIVERVFGPAATTPIAGIVLVDVGILFCGSVLAVELMRTEQPSTLKVMQMLARNPFLIAAVLGMLAWKVPSAVPEGVHTYAGFAGGAAAPASLFALGIILANKPLRPVGMATILVVFAKVALHPVMVFLFSSALVLSPGWSDATLLVAAGPCGAMPFVIALHYGIRTDTIAKSILLSTLISLMTLSYLIATI